MSDEACSCLEVDYSPTKHEDGSWSEKWVCMDCGMLFVKQVVSDARTDSLELGLAGVRWLHERDLWSELDMATDFFKALINAPIPRIAIENPIPHGHAIARIGRKYDQKVQPWQFGHGETKGICLWLKNLPPLVPTNVVAGREARVHRMPPGPDRWKERSRFFPGVAEAMADQWGGNNAAHC